MVRRPHFRLHSQLCKALTFSIIILKIDDDDDDDVKLKLTEWLSHTGAVPTALHALSHLIFTTTL